MVAFARQRRVGAEQLSGRHQVADAKGKVMPQLPGQSGAMTLSREAQERWEDDGGAIPLDPAMESTCVVGADDGPMLLNRLEVANRYHTESERRMARQRNLITKLRAKHQTTFLAAEFLRSLQASQAMHGAGRSRLQRALAILDANVGTIEPIR